MKKPDYSYILIRRISQGMKQCCELASEKMNFIIEQIKQQQNKYETKCNNLRIILHEILTKFMNDSEKTFKLRELFIDHDCQDILTDFAHVFPAKIFNLPPKRETADILLENSKNSANRKTSAELKKVYDSLQKCQFTSLEISATFQTKNNEIKPPEEVFPICSETNIKEKLSELHQHLKESLGLEKTDNLATKIVGLKLINNSAHTQVFLV